jgi:hypothetical protein
MHPIGPSRRLGSESQGYPKDKSRQGEASSKAA